MQAAVIAGLILSGYSLEPNIRFGCYIIHFRSKSFQRVDWRIAFSLPLCGGETKGGKQSRSMETIKCFPWSHIAVVRWPSQEQKTYSLTFIRYSLYSSIKLSKIYRGDIHIACWDLTCLVYVRLVTDFSLACIEHCLSQIHHRQNSTYDELSFTLGI